MDLLLSAIIVLGIGFLIWDRFKKRTGESFDPVSEKLKIELDQKSEKVGELQAELDAIKREKSELQGKGKEVSIQLISFQEKNKSLQDRNEELTKQITKAEAEKIQREKEFQRRFDEAENQRKAFEDEKLRIRREDEERLAKAEAERDRIWNDHEQASIAHMKDVCQKPELAFSFYENTNLPDSFSGRFKPDFVVDFLGQYVIFDAKMTKSASLSNYIREQVKSTATKIKSAKNKDDIYPMVFFVVPLLGIDELKSTHFYEEGINFFVITAQAFEPILHSFKRITHYELAESVDPKERENIIGLIAAYDQHINWRNAFDISISAKSYEVLQGKSKLSQEMIEKIEVTKSKIRIPSINVSEIKQLTRSSEDQRQEILKFVEPQQPLISEDDLPAEE